MESSNVDLPESPAPIKQQKGEPGFQSRAEMTLKFETLSCLVCMHSLSVRAELTFAFRPWNGICCQLKNGSGMCRKFANGGEVTGASCTALASRRSDDVPEELLVIDSLRIRRHHRGLPEEARAGLLSSADAA